MWQAFGKATFEKAASEQRPIVLFFPGEGESFGDTYIYGDDYAALSRENAIFVRIPYTANRDQAPDTGSPVPVSKLSSDNPSRDYGVNVNRATFIVTDWFGNAITNRIDKKPSAAELKSAIERVPARVQETNKKLQRDYDRAKAAWEKGDRAATLRPLLSNFKQDVVGIEAQENSIRLYHEVIDAAREQIKELADAGDVNALRGMSRELRGTDAAKDLDEAIKSAQAPKTQTSKDE